MTAVGKSCPIERERDLEHWVPKLNAHHVLTSAVHARSTPVKMFDRKSLKFSSGRWRSTRQTCQARCAAITFIPAAYDSDTPDNQPPNDHDATVRRRTDQYRFCPSDRTRLPSTSSRGERRLSHPHKRRQCG